MSSLEFAEWVAYESISPGDPERGDLQAAIVSSTIANFSGSKKKYKIKDFLLTFKSPVSAKASIKGLKTKFLFWKTMLNASNAEKRKKLEQKKNKK